MKPNLRLWILLVFCLMPILSKADWGPGPPLEAVVATFVGVSLLVYGILTLVSLLLKRIVELFRKKKKKHIWYQALCMELLFGLILYLEDTHNLLYSFEIKYGYDFRVSVFQFSIFFMLLLGWVIGYLITPTRKNLNIENKKSL
jgi:hypothetical protein